MHDLTKVNDPDSVETLKTRLLELIDRDALVREVLRKLLDDSLAAHRAR